MEFGHYDAYGVLIEKWESPVKPTPYGGWEATFPPGIVLQPGDMIACIDDGEVRAAPAFPALQCFRSQPLADPL